MTGAQPCRYCQRNIVIRRVRGRDRPVPFDKVMVRVDDVAEALRWVPTQVGAVIVMVAWSDMNPRRLDGRGGRGSVQWCATRHTCAGYVLASRRRPAGVDSLADVAGELVARWAGLDP